MNPIWYGATAHSPDVCVSMYYTHEVKAAKIERDIRRKLDDRVSKLCISERSVCLAEAICSHIGIHLAYKLLKSKTPQEYAIAYMKAELVRTVKKYVRYALYIQCRKRWETYKLSVTKKEFDEFIDTICQQKADCDYCQRIYGHAFTTAYVFSERKETSQDVAKYAYYGVDFPISQFYSLAMEEEYRRLHLELLLYITICNNINIRKEIHELLSLVNVLPQTIENKKLITAVWSEFLEEQKPQYVPVHFFH